MIALAIVAGALLISGFVYLVLCVLSAGANADRRNGKAAAPAPDERFRRGRRAQA